MCTSKEAFSLLDSSRHEQVPQHGSRGISTQALDILRRTWRHKTLPPCIKAFVWRLIRRALATGERAGYRSTKIDKHCSVCSIMENDSHLFFHCSFARAVWFTGSPSLLTSSLPQEQDGVQEALSRIIDNNTTENEFHKIMTTLWYIWKARNDAHFKNAKWSVLQVHDAVAADMKITGMDEMSEENQQQHLTSESQTPYSISAGTLRIHGEPTNSTCSTQGQVPLTATHQHCNTHQHDARTNNGHCNTHKHDAIDSNMMPPHNNIQIFILQVKLKQGQTIPEMSIALMQRSIFQDLPITKF